MARMKLGVVLESLGQPLRPALTLVSGFSVPGVQFDAVGPLAPDELSQTGRKEVRHLLRSLNLEVAAVGCPLRHGFDVEQGLDSRVAHVKKVLTLAFDLGPRTVIVYPGPIPTEEKTAAWELITHALTELGRHGDRVGSFLALETGLEPPEQLRAYLDKFTCGGLAVNVDPATLLANRHDPAAAVRALQHHVRHAHARDVRPGRPDRTAQEVPLGHGDVDWTAFLGALEEVGYHGWLTVKRGLSANPVSDVQGAVKFLRRMV